MWKHASLLILAILISLSANSQKTLSVAQVDKESYALFQKGQWNELISFAAKANKEGVDFYYLQYRLAIANYELKKYRTSADLFQKLYQDNTEDAIIKEYLYFSYLLGGQEKDAVRIQNNLAQSTSKKYGIGKTKFVSGIYSEVKNELLDDYSVESDQLQEQTVRKNFLHYSIGLNHQLGERVSLFQAFSHVDVKNSIVSETYFFDEDLTQNQYYLKSTIQLDWGSQLILAAHWLTTKINGNPLNVQNEVAAIEPQVKAGNGPGGGGNQSDPVITDSGVELYPYSFKQNSFIAYLGLQQKISNLQLELGVLYSSMNNETRWQQEIALRYYPLGNTNLYFTCSFANQMEKEQTSTWLNRKYWKVGTGFRLAKNTWANAGYTFGDLYKQVENQGYSIFNGVNRVKNRKEFSIYQYLSKGKLNLFLIYQNQNEKNNYTINDVINSQNINVQSITGGIKWNF